jgi:predicted ABC-type ATPase
LTSVIQAVRDIRQAQEATEKPLAVIVAGHNGSGKSTFWRGTLADEFHIPLINADRMMLSILPEPDMDGALPEWASHFRDTNERWMRVAQQGVQTFVNHAMNANVSFAMETVFSHWHQRPDGIVESKLDLIHDLQSSGYFVMLVFVGLTNAGMSISRVATRVAQNGHNVPEQRLRERFPRTQKAIAEAIKVADASLLADNSRDTARAFTLCRSIVSGMATYDIRDDETNPSTNAILSWLNIVSPRP